MSAYPGTRQLYGRAKLATELAARARGLCVVRPGLVYGPGWGGMAGTLRRLAALPVLPDFGPRARQFTVSEHDFAAALLALARAEHVPALPVGIAHPDPVPFTELLTSFAASLGKPRPRFVATPPMVVYGALRAAELLPVKLPVRADSLLGLVRPAPNVPHLEVLDQLGVVLQPFALSGAGAGDGAGETVSPCPVCPGAADLAGRAPSAPRGQVATPVGTYGLSRDSARWEDANAAGDRSAVDLAQAVSIGDQQHT